MTTMIPSATELADARELRARIRAWLADEYLRLRTVDRPALLAATDDVRTDDGLAPAVAAIELGVVERRIDAIHDYLGIAHDDAHGAAACEDCCAVIDAGEGPRLILLARIAVTDDQVVTTDSNRGGAVVLTASVAGAVLGDPGRRAHPRAEPPALAPARTRPRPSCPQPRPAPLQSYGPARRRAGRL